MSVILGLKPYNAISHGTVANGGTKPIALEQNSVAIALFLSTCAATLTIWKAGPIGDWLYECSILSLAGFLLLGASPISWRFAIPLGLLGTWGFLQLAVEATVYRHATLQASLQFAAMAAAAFVSYRTLASPLFQEQFLKAFAWFGFLLSILGVLAYYTSPQQILWLFDAPYPDVWGPFLSRNNFAQFLELTLPVALWLAFRKPAELLYWAMAASMLTAGLVSASRAGAVLLLLESVAIFWLCGQRRIRWAAIFAVTVLFLAVLTGAGTLVDRLRSPNPLAYRDQLYQSSAEIIESRPWQGYGLGTFAWVYPQFAKFDSGYRIEHAHNDWLEWMSEGGLGFCAIWALLAVPASFRSFRNPWSLGIPAVFLHALVDYPFARLGVAAWVFILLGALERTRYFMTVLPGERQGQRREYQHNATDFSAIHPGSGPKLEPKRGDGGVTGDRDRHHEGRLPYRQRNGQRERHAL